MRFSYILCICFDVYSISQSTSNITIKKMKNLIVFLIAATLILSCDAPSSEDEKSAKTDATFSTSYQAPVFVNDDRKEKILSIVDTVKPLFEKHMKLKHIPGVAYGIVVDNELIFMDAIGKINLNTERQSSTESCFRIASMTKSFTAMAIMKLRDEKRLNLHDPVSKYIPEMSKLTYLTSDAPSITIQNLLTMTAGFPEDNPWGDRQLDESDQMLIDLIDEGLSFSNVPYHRFEYSNTGYALLGNIITSISGIPYQEYIKNNILLPLEMDNTYWEYTDIPDDKLVQGYRWEDEQWKEEPLLHDGSYGAMGGLITSIEDFAKYVSFQLSAWPPRNGDETGPIKRSSLREMQTPTFSHLYANAKDLKGDPCAVMSGYGYGLGIAKNCDGVTQISHGGALPGFGSNYRFYPEYGIGIMAFCNLTYTSPWPVKEISTLLFETLDLQARQLPVSDILAIRQNQIVDFMQDLNQPINPDILAENFYLDKSKEHRTNAIQEILTEAGEIKNIQDIKPQNQLRGQIIMNAEHGDINIFFTLSPEKIPKIQLLDVWFEPHDPEK